MQFPTMPDWVGTGVVTPLPGTVVVDVEVVLVDDWVVVVDDRVVVVNDRIVDVDVVFPEVDVVGVPDTGGWPQFCSMQYEFPKTREQELARDGFYGRRV